MVSKSGFSTFFVRSCTSNRGRTLQGRTERPDPVLMPFYCGSPAVALSQPWRNPDPWHAPTLMTERTAVHEYAPRFTVYQG